MGALNFPVAPAISLLLQVYSTPDIKSCLQVEMEIKWPEGRASFALTKLHFA